METVDTCLGQVVSAVHAAGGACVTTADHGNAEELLSPDGHPSTAHSLNPVPLIVNARDVALRGHGTLADVAPTVLELLGMNQPSAMSGHSLLQPQPDPLPDPEALVSNDGVPVLANAPGPPTPT